MATTTNSVTSIPGINLEKIQEQVSAFVVDKGFDVLGAVIILIFGGLAARWLGRIVERWLSVKEIDLPLRHLIVKIIRLLVFGMAVLLSMEKFGVKTAPLIAGLSVAGVGVGLAMQGMLSNLVAGLNIIFTKPFRVGEYIELLGVNGQVDNVKLFSTVLVHADRSRIVIPNRKIIGEILHNYGQIRQLDLSVGVAYSSDLNETIRTVQEILQANPRVLKDPAPVVGVSLLADSSINIAIKPWTTLADYGNASAELNKAIVENFRHRRIEIPFPQREVRLLNNEPAARVQG